MSNVAQLIWIVGAKLIVTSLDLFQTNSKLIANAICYGVITIFAR